MKELASPLGQVQMVASPFLSSLDQAVTLHAAQDLTHVALRDEQRVRKRLLSLTLGCCDMRQHIKMSQAHP
jgi:hypothetical protein